MVHTLELLQHPPIADAWHNVTAPGGYEWWYFDAEDVEHDRQIVAMLFDGCPFHSGYLRKYFAYARNPTRVPPPRPSEYICAYFAVYHAGQIEHQFMTQYPADVFEGRLEKRHVTIGANRFAAGNALQRLELTMGGIDWKSVQRSRRLRKQMQKEISLWADLRFLPRFASAPAQHELFSREFAGSGGAHRWIIANSLCDVEGDILMPGSGHIRFRGRGYHDHQFGTGPIGSGIKQWFRGRLLLNDRCITFQLVHPRDRRREAEMHLVEIDAGGARQIDVEPSQIAVDWSQRTWAWLRYPNVVRLGDVLALANPRVIDSSWFNLRIIYDASLRGQRGTALCELTYPHRLRWPLLGRTIERSIDKRAM